VDQPREEYQAVYVIRESKVQGYCLLRRVQIDPLHIHEDPWLVEYVHVCPAVRRTGVGTHLLRRVVSLYPELTACCVGGKELFESVGFVDHGAFHRYG